MKLETAYQAANMVTALREAQNQTAEAKLHARHAEFVSDKELRMQVTYDHTRGVEDLGTIDLDYHESLMFFQFIDELLRKREQDIEFEIGRLENNNNIIKLSYNQYMNAARPNAKVFEEVLQTDLLVLITEKLLNEAEEVWLFHDIVEGNPGRRLK